MFLTKDEVLMG